jgi:rhodanese-related sulfurtransferase
VTVLEEAIMLLTLTVAGITAIAAFFLLRRARVAGRRAQFEKHSITAEELHTLLALRSDVRLYDLRLPLDVLTDAEIIPGAQRVSPQEVLHNPNLIPKEEDSIVYCTCPGEESSREVLKRALEMGYLHVRFLRGGLAAWKARGYRVEPYSQPFRLDPAIPR